MPKISINIPCYNRPQMLLECVQSFIKQTYKDFEIVIVDDGSERDISFVKYLDSRVKYIRQTHKGIPFAFNLALDNSIGNYIMPFGSDDIALPYLLEETIGLMEKYKNEYDVIYSNFYIQNNRSKLHKHFCNKTLNQEDAYKMMLKRQYIPHGGTLWKKEKYPRYNESFESAVDWELFLTAMESGVKFKHARKGLWIYRIGHINREFGSQRQIDCCNRILRKRGYRFDIKKRIGIKCN